jgi:hypothetical protein
MILKLSLNKVTERRMDLCGLGKGLVAGFCECGNEHSALIKVANNFFDWLRSYMKASGRDILHRNS